MWGEVGVTWGVPKSKARKARGTKSSFTHISVCQEGESRKGRRERENQQRENTLEEQTVPRSVKAPSNPCPACEGVSILSPGRLSGTCIRLCI